MKQVIDVNNNPVRLTNELRSTRSPSLSENSSLAQSSSQPLPPLQPQQRYNDSIQRSTQILNSNQQLFQKINKIQPPIKQQPQPLTPPASNSSANNLYTDNKRRLSLLLARKS